MSSKNFPSPKTFAFFWGLGCICCAVVFYIYPWVVGQCVDLAFGHFSIPLFLARHPVIYAGVQLLPRIGYMCLSLASLDLFFLLFLYRVFDELVTRQGVLRGLLAVARRALKPLFVGQVLAGSVLCLFLGWIPSFSYLSLLPVFFSASFAVGIFTGLWVISTCLFGLSFAVTENAREAWAFSKKMAKKNPFFWGLFLLAVLITGWLPAFIFITMGVSGGAFLSVFYLVFGMFNQLIVWSGFLSWLLADPDALAVK